MVVVKDDSHNFNCTWFLFWALASKLFLEF